MKLVINHLTRMKPGFVCVAGVDLDSRKHVRPVLSGGTRLSADLLRGNGGPFDIAEVVDIADPRPRPIRPEMEDQVFQGDKVRRKTPLTGSEFWKLIRELSSSRLRNLFGKELVQIGPSACGVNIGQGEASLGCYLPKKTPTLTAPNGKNIRLMFDDPDFQGLDLGVTDIRLYGADHWTPDAAKVQTVAAKIAKGENCILSIGLGRPWSSDPQRYPKMHWLQVNNIHLESDPTWKLG
jgi:hypothetical protein